MKTMVLDIGGTAIKSAVAENGVLSDIRETPTQASLGGEHVMALAKEIIASYKEHWDFARIGISTAGQVDPEKAASYTPTTTVPAIRELPSEPSWKRHSMFLSMWKMT